MFLNEKREANLNGAILLFSCFFCAVFATIQPSPIAITQSKNVVPCNSYGPRVAAINGADDKLSVMAEHFRNRPPNAFCVMIESCTDLMTKNPTFQKFETRPFNVGGFNWTFILEPFGRTDRYGSWISTYVAIDPLGLVGKTREVFADIRFLVYSKTKDQYWQSFDTELMRFHQFGTTLGNPTFVRHYDFTAKDREYIFGNDQCVFGVDISVYPYFNNWEVLSIDKTVYGPMSWKLSRFSTLQRDFYVSDEFSAGGKKWALKVYPKGNGTGKGNFLSLYVILSRNQTMKLYEKVLVRAKLRVLDQRQSRHLEKPILSWFNTPGEGSGFDQFVSFNDLHNPANGFMVSDTLSVQVQFEAISSTKHYSTNAAQLMSTF